MSKLNADGTPSVQNGKGGIMLDPIRLRQVVAALQRGASRETAAAYAGVTTETLRAADARGRAPDAPEEFRVIHEAIVKAESEFTVKLTERIYNAGTEADGDWKAAGWLLERRRPSEYGKTSELIIGDKNVTKMTPAEQDALTLDYIVSRLVDAGRQELADEVREALK